MTNQNSAVVPADDEGDPDAEGSRPATQPGSSASLQQTGQTTTAGGPANALVQGDDRSSKTRVWRFWARVSVILGIVGAFVTLFAPPTSDLRETGWAFVAATGVAFIVFLSTPYRAFRFWLILGFILVVGGSLALGAAIKSDAAGKRAAAASPSIFIKAPSDGYWIGQDPIVITGTLGSKLTGDQEVWSFNEPCRGSTRKSTGRLLLNRGRAVSR
jgi:hypothetical protein